MACARLPTEDEWLVFAQCGDGRTYPWGNDWPPKYGNYAGEETEAPIRSLVIAGYRDGHVVACDVEQSGGNDWGLYGVGGNVCECCAANGDIPQRFGAQRGASWFYCHHDYLRCDARADFLESVRNFYLGFRLVLSR